MMLNVALVALVALVLLRAYRLAGALGEAGVWAPGPERAKRAPLPLCLV